MSTQLADPVTAPTAPAPKRKRAPKAAPAVPPPVAIAAPPVEETPAPSAPQPADEVASCITEIDGMRILGQRPDQALPRISLDLRAWRQHIWPAPLAQPPPAPRPARRVQWSPWIMRGGIVAILVLMGLFGVAAGNVLSGNAPRARLIWPTTAPARGAAADLPAPTLPVLAVPTARPPVASAAQPAQPVAVGAVAEPPTATPHTEQGPLLGYTTEEATEIAAAPPPAAVPPTVAVMRVTAAQVIIQTQPAPLPPVPPTPVPVISSPPAGAGNGPDFGPGVTPVPTVAIVESTVAGAGVDGPDFGPGLTPLPSAVAPVISSTPGCAGENAPDFGPGSCNTPGIVESR